MSYPPIVISAGDRFGRFTVIAEAERHRRSSGVPVRMLFVRCDCGTQKSVRMDSLRNGKTVSCGCFHRELSKSNLAKSAVTHGQSKTSLHRIWSAMKARCSNPNNKRWASYGGRGISVCEEWRQSFEAFAAHVGPKPDGKTLDRIDNDGNYEPGNVRWATYQEQARNNRHNAIVELNGRRMTLVEAAEILGVKYDSIQSSISRGTPLHRKLGVVRV